MGNIYDIYGESHKYKDKSRCGDYFLHNIFHDKFVVLALSDGVGSRPCDWLASKNTCEKLVELIGENINKNPNFVSNDLVDICVEVDRFVSNETGKCKGMLSTLAAIIWNIEDNFMHFFNVGDSRIYKISKDDEITQISSDDSSIVNIRNKNGKLVLQSGSIVERTGLTNAFGLLNASIKPKKCDFNSGDTIVLASDGFYDCCSSFNIDILNISHSISLNESISKLMHYYREYQKDDSTILVLRNNKANFDLPENKIDIDYHEIKNRLAKFQIISIMYEKLKQCIIQKNENIALDNLIIMENELILPSKEMLDSLLQLMKDVSFNDKQVFNRIVGLIRQIMK